MDTSQRKTYPLGGKQSLKLAKHSVAMGEKLKKTVTKQSILEALVDCLADKEIYKKVIEKLA